MRHRMKSKIGSYTPEKQSVEIEQLEDSSITDDVEEIFEEDSNFSNDGDALAAMEIYESPNVME